MTKVLYRTFGQNRKTEYGYGLEERLESAQLPGGKTVTYGYDGFNRMIQRKLGNLHTVTYEYEVPVIGKTSGRLSRMINGGTALSYTYDAAGNITTIVENGTERVRYRYDELNQLVREDSAVQNKSIEYVYDGGGNLLARKEYAYTTGELGGVMNTVSYGYSGSWKDLLTSYNGTAISYDTIGNPLTWRGGLSFTWQNGRQLSTAQKSGLSLSYQYNASGIRTEKTVNGVTTEYYLDGSSIVAEKTGTDVIWYLYDGMGLAGFELNGTSYYYVYNGQGDVIGILDSSGNRVVTYTYDSWGSPLSVTGSLASTVGQKNPIRYRGYYYDTETGLYYLQSRYYDPVVGRFLNADGLLGANGDLMSYNLFAYCSNNPVNMSDPTGEIAAVTAAFIGLAAAVILQGFTPENKERADNFMNEPNLYNTANWLTLGAVDTVKGAIRPEEPLSLQHWADSAQTALMVMPAVYGIGKSLSTVKPSCFWSGGGMANAGSAAMDFAKLQGSKTLETTMKGRLLSKLPSRISRPLWQPLSRQYAQQARGPVYAIINDNYVRANSIFYTDELPILWENYMNGQVTSIHILHY